MDYFQWAASRCAAKEYCRSEILKKLLEKGADNQETEAVLERLEKERYIDEGRYAHAFSSDKIRFNGWGKVKVRYALRNKGLSDAVIEEALAQIDEQTYVRVLKDFIASRRRTLQAPTSYALGQKVARAAISRGFEPSLVFSLIGSEGEE